MSGLEWLQPHRRLPAEPVTDDSVRSTVDVVNDTAPSAEETGAPGVNEYLSDPDTGNGLTTRHVNGHTYPSEQYVPDWENANEQLTNSVNAQVSTSGTAAAREAAGRWGHGTLQWTNSLEPVIGDDRPGMDNVYFEADPTRRPQDNAGNEISSPLPASQTALNYINATSRQASRQAGDNGSVDPLTAYVREQTGIL